MTNGFLNSIHLKGDRMMKAWTIPKANPNSRIINLPSETLVLQNVPIPAIVNDNEVLVKLKSSSINFNAVWSCMREPIDPFGLLAGHIKRNPHDSHHNLDYCIPGSDGAGVVVQVGVAVSDFIPGDEVVIHCAVISDDDKNMQDPMLSKTQSIWGYETNYGAFAEFTLVKSSQLIKKPTCLDFITAGSCLLTLGTAYRMLISENGAQIKKGEICLIWGASGGLGVFALQLCLSIGAIPVCIVSDEEKARHCKSIGADKIVICERKEQDSFVDSSGKPNYTNWRKFEKKLINIIGTSRVDCVFEHIGRNVFSLSVFLLRRGGRLVTCAATTGYEALVDIRFIWMEMKTIIGSHFCNSKEANEALELLSVGSVKHTYEKAINFSGIPDAIDLLYLRKSRGKIVVQY
jgi:crotonyl-CoA reductase